MDKIAAGCALLDTLSRLIWILHVQNPCLSTTHFKNIFIFSKLIITAYY